MGRALCPAQEGMRMLGAGLIESGSIQFIIFGVMVIAIFVALFITIAK